MSIGPTMRLICRRALRSKLRTTGVLLVIVCAAPLLWRIEVFREEQSPRNERAKRRKAAVEALQKVPHCRVVYEEDLNGLPVIQDGSAIDRKPAPDRNVIEENMRGNVFGVDAGKADLTDATLLNLRELTEVKHLTLSGTEITDAGLSNLEPLTKLEVLWINAPKISDEGLAHLARLTQLRMLVIQPSQITDSGLVHLQGLTRLKSLNLANSNVTDAGLVHLESLKQLRELLLTNLSPAAPGAKALQQSLPELQLLLGFPEEN